MCSLISLMYTVYIYIRMTALKDMLKTTTCQHGKADGMMLFLACHSLFVMSIIMHTNETHFVFIFCTSVTHRWVCFLFTLKWSSCVEFHSLSSILCKRTLSFQYRLMCSLISLMYTVYIYKLVSGGLILQSHFGMACVTNALGQAYLTNMLVRWLIWHVHAERVYWRGNLHIRVGRARFTVAFWQGLCRKCARERMHEQVFATRLYDILFFLFGCYLIFYAHSGY